MFLGNLSTTTERKAWKAEGTKKKSETVPLLSQSPSTDLEISYLSIGPTNAVPSGIKRAPKGSISTVYDRNNSDVPREVMLGFFRDCAALLLDEDTIREIVSDNMATGVGLFALASDFQRDILENNFAIERNFGCQYMASLSSIVPNDLELLEAGKKFTFAAVHSYLHLITYRTRVENRRKGTSRLRTEGGMTRTLILEFFEGCNCLMVMPETKAGLIKACDEVRGPPNEKVVALQRDVLKQLGLDPDYGVSQLNLISKVYPNDKEMMHKFDLFVCAAEVATREATFTDAGRAKFYADIPLFLHSFPHMFVMQQQLRMEQAMQEEQMRRQQMGQTEGTTQTHGQNQGMSILKQSGMLELLSTEDGRDSVARLNERMSAAKDRVEPIINDWDFERKKVYFETFSDHPAILELNAPSIANDPVAKLKRFIEMTDSDLDDMMKMQCIITYDIQSGGVLMKAINTDGSARSKGVLKNMHAMRSISGSVALQPPAAGANKAASNSSSYHDHAAHTGHSNGAPTAYMPPPPIRSAKTNVMER